MLKAQGWFFPELGAQQKDLRSVTPLHLTARAGHYEQLEWIVNHGADIRALGFLMNAPLHECSVSRRGLCLHRFYHYEALRSGRKHH